MNNRRITVAIDFGTTYSTVAYSNPSDETKEPLLIKDWGSGPSSEGVPTVLRYNATDRLGGAFGFKWGFEVKHHERRQEWFKLALDPMVYKASETIDLADTYSSELADPPDYSRSAAKLCTDFLTALRKQAQKTLEDKYGSSALKTMRINWVITVPAVWSMKAKDDTLTCARDAGIGAGQKISIVSEPEAAAAYALQAIEPLNLKTGQNFVVCDAGGGTVDLITYRLQQLEPLEVEESAIPSGGKCGGTFVNRIFEKMIMTRFGENSGLTDIGKHQLLQHFEQYAKREFQDTGNPHEEWYLPAAGAKNNYTAGISGGSIILSVDDMKKAFDPVVNEVIKLVKCQISGIKGVDNKVEAVVLVGGFGESRYLRQRVQAAIHPIELLCPLNQWGAIAMGAVIQGIATRNELPGRSWNVTTRKATSHMGIEIREPFVDGKHDVTHKQWDACDGKFFCHQIMRWFVNRGDDLSDTLPASYPFYRNIRVGNSLKITEELMYSHNDYAPLYCNAQDCHDHATMKVDLTPIKQQLKKIRGLDGKDYYRVDFQILATYHSAHVEYQWQFNGQIFDKVKCNYI